MANISPQWNDVERWWDKYIQNQERGLIELRELVEELNQRWKRSSASFDEDPLVADWTESSPQAGPLRTNQEENWSQWLAHLIRDSSGEYTTELFDSPRYTEPEHVRCEKAYLDEELHDRRVDILAEFESQGVTIEVKIGDENYKKTPQTAYLTEKHHQKDLDWTHYLLLPQSKQKALQAVFDAQMSTFEGQRPIINANRAEACDVTVLYWSEVSQALRRTLLSGTEPSNHWNASAYLFTTLIEEQIQRFYPSPSLEEYRHESLGVSEIERLQSIDPDDQVEYLKEFSELITRE